MLEASLTGGGSSLYYETNEVSLKLRVGSLYLDTENMVDPFGIGSYVPGKLVVLKIVNIAVHKSFQQKGIFTYLVGKLNAIVSSNKDIVAGVAVMQVQNKYLMVHLMKKKKHWVLGAADSGFPCFGMFHDSTVANYVKQTTGALR